MKKKLNKGENGEVEYEILSTHSNEKNMPFRIDPLTGLIQTNLVFDRESNGKFNEYSITVKAKDRGKPHPLSDACSFRIKIRKRAKSVVCRMYSTIKHNILSTKAHYDTATTYFGTTAERRNF